MILHNLFLLPPPHLAECHLVHLHLVQRQTATSPLEVSHVWLPAHSIGLPFPTICGTSLRKYLQLYIWQWKIPQVYGYQRMMKIGWEDLVTHQHVLSGLTVHNLSTHVRLGALV